MPGTLHISSHLISHSYAYTHFTDTEIETQAGNVIFYIDTMIIPQMVLICLQVLCTEEPFILEELSNEIMPGQNSESWQGNCLHIAKYNSPSFPPLVLPIFFLKFSMY